MKWGLGGILTGALALIVGQVVLTASANSASGASNLLSIAQVPAKLAQNWMSPDVPLIPDLSKTKAASSGSSSSSANPKGLSVGQLANPHPSSNKIPAVPGK